MKAQAPCRLARHRTPLTLLPCRPGRESCPFSCRRDLEVLGMLLQRPRMRSWRGDPGYQGVPSCGSPEVVYLWPPAVEGGHLSMDYSERMRPKGGWFPMTWPARRQDRGPATGWAFRACWPSCDESDSAASVRRVRGGRLRRVALRGRELGHKRGPHLSATFRAQTGNRSWCRRTRAGCLTPGHLLLRPTMGHPERGCPLRVQ